MSTQATVQSPSAEGQRVSVSNAERYAERLQRFHAAQEKHEEKIARAEARLGRLKAKWPECPSWIDELVRPIADAMARQYPGHYFEVLGPFGIGSTVSIHASPKAAVDADADRRGFHCVGSLTFRPGRLDKGEIMLVDYFTNTGKYRENSIGEINGLNHPEVPLPDFEELCRLIWRKESGPRTEGP